MINRNVEQLNWVAEALGELVSDVVFLGGCTTALLVEEKAMSDARATEDVDFIVDISTYVAYHNFTDKLKAKGFYQSMGDDVICRWRIEFKGSSLMVDVMAVSEEVLGFSNPWYPEAYKTSTKKVLPGGIEIRIPLPLIFIATKFCAWQGRGDGDVALSQDLEDIVFVLENRPRLPIEFKECGDKALKDYISSQSQEILGDQSFLNYLPGIATRDSKSVLNCLRLFAKNN